MSDEHKYITAQALKDYQYKLFKDIKYRHKLIIASNLPDKLRKNNDKYGDYQYHGMSPK